MGKAQQRLQTGFAILISINASATILALETGA